MNPRILLADDDPEMLNLIEDLLVRHGAEVVRADNGAMLVLQLAEQGPFDLVITDISMPWMSGLQVVRSLRRAGVNAPVLFITGLDDDALLERVAAMGRFTRLLRKPFMPEELESAVDDMLRHSAEQE